MDMSSEEKARGIALAAGAIVALGIIYAVVKSSKKCTEFPGIWAQDNPLNLTNDAQERAFASARERTRAALTAQSGFDAGVIALAVANDVQECDWSKRPTEKSRQVWAGINKVVSRVFEEAKTQPEKFF